MLTVGQILKKARTEKKISLEEIEKKTRIRQKFLIALENEEWEKLPSLPYIKGFIKNYSSFLGLKSDEMLAIFRRQFTDKEKARLLPVGMSEPLNEPLFRFTPQKIFISTIIFLLVIFFGYLFSQYKAYTGKPSLTVNSPQEGEIFNNTTINISGKTAADATVSINNQKIQINDSGEFNQTITVPTGINTIIISSRNKFGKENIVRRTIQAQAQ